MSALAVGYVLDKFPAEFEKNLWHDFDRRFISIVLGSWFVIYTIAVLLGSIEYDMDLLSAKARANYLRMIKEYPAAQILDPSGVELKDEDAITDPAQGVIQPTNEKTDVSDSRADRNHGPSAVEMINDRRAREAARNSMRKQMENEVAGIGVLGVLSAGGDGGGTGTAVFDGFTGGSGGSADLASVLSGVSGLASAGDHRGQTVLGQRGGGRVLRSAAVEELLSGLGGAKSSSIERKGSLEVIMETARITGATGGKTSRSQDEISRVIIGHTAAVEYCYKRETKLNPNLAGSILVEFLIGVNGRVKNVLVVNSTLQNQAVESCITGRMKGWRFKPVNAADGDVLVKQKYIFS